jgi:tetratricopeptide (TPR) repeat protein
VRAACAFLLVAGLCAPARAEEFWHRSDTRKRDLLTQVGDRHLNDARQTDAALRSTPAPPPSLVRDYLAEQARAALGAYEGALQVGPETAELHYRAFLAATYLVTAHEGVARVDREGYAAVVRHVEGVRRLSPLDTREDDLAFQAGLAYSKLGGLGGPDADAAFGNGIREYERFRSFYGRRLSGELLASTYSNEAELLMAVGRLDDAIAYYRTSIELNPLEPLGYFGLAVALDRNGEASKAAEAMRDADRHGKGVDRLKSPTVFFVPSGDIDYYYGLYHEVRGDPVTATIEYNRFLERCKDTKYAERARAHLAELGGRAAPAH